jgi:predicted SprT family Zn-dependent metalloprotease
MLLSDAKTLAVNLMRTHNLIQNGWVFKFDNAKRRFGCCNYRTKTISLSKHLVEINEIGRVRNTILHEIAHALVGRGHGHDDVWKRKAIEIGCDGNRCYSVENTNIVKGSFVAICPKCNGEHHRHRRPKKKSSCGLCSNTYDVERLLIFEKK